MIPNRLKKNFTIEYNLLHPMYKTYTRDVKDPE